MTSPNDPSPPPQPVQTGPDAQRLYPFAMLALIFALLTARWIWIAGISDHGWIYEVGMRVWLGEVPYRDYICALPQLTTYTIVPLLALLNGSMWAVQIHLYLWWLASLVVGLQVVRRLGLSAGAQAGGIFLAACASFPAICLGHSYSYAGTAFFGLVLLRLLRHRESEKARDFFVAGIFAGLAVLAKQNLGAVAVLLGLVAVVLAVFRRQSLKSCGMDVLIFASGTLTVFLPAFGYFAIHAGMREVFSQMFLDAGAGKGGTIGMMLHAVPALFFTEGTPHRALWMGLLSGAVLLFFLWLFGWRKPAARPLATGQPVTRDEARRPLLVCFGAVALLLVVSLFDFPRLKSCLNVLRADCFYPNQAYVGVLMFVCYSAVVALSAVCLWRCLRGQSFELFLPALALPLLTCGHDLSTRGYLPFAAPVALPLAVFFLERFQLVARPARLASVTGAFIVLVQLAFPQATYNAPTFEPILRLPAQTKFAHLWGARNYARYLEVMAENITPRIRGERTLWFNIGGAHLAFGGKPVRSVALLHSDSYNGRSEPELFAEWERNPPNFVFVGYYVPCANSTGFRPEALQAWLAERYERVYTNAEYGTALWEVKNSNKTRSH